jgi:hypothetical protein
MLDSLPGRLIRESLPPVTLQSLSWVMLIGPEEDVHVGHCPDQEEESTMDDDKARMRE